MKKTEETEESTRPTPSTLHMPWVHFPEGVRTEWMQMSNCCVLCMGISGTPRRWLSLRCFSPPQLPGVRCPLVYVWRHTLNVILYMHNIFGKVSESVDPFPGGLYLSFFLLSCSPSLLNENLCLNFYTCVTMCSVCLNS